MKSLKMVLLSILIVGLVASVASAPVLADTFVAVPVCGDGRVACVTLPDNALSAAGYSAMLYTLDVSQTKEQYYYWTDWDVMAPWSSVCVTVGQGVNVITFYHKSRFVWEKESTNSDKWCLHMAPRW